VLEQRADAAISKEFVEFNAEREEALQEAGREAEQREVERATRRAEMEKQLGELHLQKRHKIDWTRIPNWKFDQKAISLPGSKFGMKALTARVAPHLTGVACDYMSYERSVITGLEREQRIAHAQLAQRAFMDLIFQPIVAEPAPPDTRFLRRITFATGDMLLNQNESMVGFEFGKPPDQARNPRELVEPASFENLWGFRYLPPERRHLRRAVLQTLRRQVVIIADDDRSRAQMVEDCKVRHGLNENKDIYAAAKEENYVFYRWLQGTSGFNNRSQPHRHFIRVLNSPVWPPFIEW
jgi:hypothetical protein